MRATRGWFYCGGVSDGACGTAACCFLRVVFFFFCEAGGELFAGGHRDAAAGARHPWGPSVPYQSDTLTFGAKHIHKNVIHCKY